MKISLKKYKYEKIEIADKIVELPDNPIYYFETGIRRAIRIVPKWTTWNLKAYGKPEFIYEFKITFIYRSMECRIEQFKIPYNSIESLYYSESKNHNDLSYFIKSWIDGELLNRTEQDFDNDFSALIDELNT